MAWWHRPNRQELYISDVLRSIEYAAGNHYGWFKQMINYRIGIDEDVLLRGECSSSEY